MPREEQSMNKPVSVKGQSYSAITNNVGIHPNMAKVTRDCFGACDYKVIVKSKKFFLISCVFSTILCHFLPFLCKGIQFLFSWVIIHLKPQKHTANVINPLRRSSTIMRIETSERLTLLCPLPVYYIWLNCHLTVRFSSALQYWLDRTPGSEHDTTLQCDNEGGHHPACPLHHPSIMQQCTGICSPLTSTLFFFKWETFLSAIFNSIPSKH